MSGYFFPRVDENNTPWHKGVMFLSYDKARYIDKNHHKSHLRLVVHVCLHFSHVTKKKGVHWLRDSGDQGVLQEEGQNGG